MADLHAGQSTSAAATTVRKAGESPVERAFRVLQTVVASGESIGVLELGRRTGLPRSTVSRLVATLEQLGMVDRTAEGLVIPGSALATLHPGAGATPMLEDRLRPLLTELVQTFDENAALSVDDGDSLLYLAQVTSSHPVSVPDVSGQHHRFHLVAPGLVSMAYWTQKRLRSYLAATLDAPAPTSMTTSRKLRPRLEQIRDDGWCWTDQELDHGVNGLGVPIESDGKLLATVSLFGPSYRFSPDIRPGIAAEVAALVSERAASLL